MDANKKMEAYLNNLKSMKPKEIDEVKERYFNFCKKYDNFFSEDVYYIEIQNITMDNRDYDQFSFDKVTKESEFDMLIENKKREIKGTTKFNLAIKNSVDMQSANCIVGAA